MNMLDHQKLILENVKFDRSLFEKELSKSIKWLSNKEIIELHQWCKNEFGNEYPEIIHKVFNIEAA